MERKVLSDVSIEDVKPYYRNYLSHDNNVEFIKNSIRDFGFNKISIGIDESNVILYGHGTLEALKKLNYKTIPHVYQVLGLTEKQKSAYRIADNSSGNGADIVEDNLKLELDLIDLEFDMKDYGLELDLIDGEMPNLGDGSDPDIQQMTFILSNEQADIVKDAISKALKTDEAYDEINQNKNGNALAAICRAYE